MSKNLSSIHRSSSIACGFGRRVALYVRRSDPAQETSLRAFAEAQPGDWRTVKVYTGNGYTSLAHDDAHLLCDAKAAAFDTLHVHGLDRFSRNLGSLARLLQSLSDANVVVRSATEPMVGTSTSVGRLTMTMLGVSAEIGLTMRRRASATQTHPARSLGAVNG